MIAVLGDNIVSSLGFTSAENFIAVRAGKSGVVSAEGVFGLPEPFVASFVDKDRLEGLFRGIYGGNTLYTPLEKAMIVSAASAIASAGIDASSPRTLFVISTTKGNVELLGCAHDYEQERIHIWRSAELVARFFGNPCRPVAVSNACISGGSAQITASRLIESGRYDNAVVVGGDMLSRFIVSGFQSFQALSPEKCRPFDASRRGLNLGEGAATIILGRKESIGKGDIMLEGGAVRNDANHISGPSRTGEGLYNAITAAMGNCSADEIAFVNAHGTATPYNDEMESIALSRAGMTDVPVNSLKGYFGHTLGAAGVVESIISYNALREGIVLASLGYSENGVSNELNVARETSGTEKRKFIKMLSGFGGCNSVLIYGIER